MEQPKKILSPPDIAPGMFSSSQILQCLQKGLLLANWNRECLMPATYEMRLGAFACWYTGGVRTAWLMGPEEDRNRGINRNLILKPNSLTFVTTVESFNMPRDVAARINLLSRWVRKGLLLGTAPIVEPEFSGQLLIPIHNFSSCPVQVDFGERFIAAEFTKILAPEGDYIPNPDPHGNINAYLERAGVVESSVSSALTKNQNLFNNIQSKTKIFSIAGGITLFLLICSALTLVINIFNVAENARKSAAAADAVVKNYSLQNEAEFKKFRDEIREMEFNLQKMKEALAQKKEQAEK